MTYNYTDALEYYNKLVSDYNESGNFRALVYAYKKIGYLYSQMKDIKNAKFYYGESKYIYREEASNLKIKNETESLRNEINALVCEKKIQEWDQNFKEVNKINDLILQSYIKLKKVIKERLKSKKINRDLYLSELDKIEEILEETIS